MTAKGLPKGLLLAAVLLPGVAFAQDPGATVFKKCKACHEVGPGAANRIGPQLNGLEGRKAGTVAGFTYSAANKKANLIWDEANFLAYIKDPQAKIANTKKTFTGLKDEDEAKSLWAYLRQFAPDGESKTR
jgi:cytochrome c